MTAFVVFGAVMVLAAIALVAYPLLRPLPALVKGEPASPKAPPLAFALSVVLILGAVGLYLKINNFPWNSPMSAAAVPAGHGSMGDAGSMAQVTAELEARLQQNPADLEGWRMLGRTYLVSGDANKAAAAYEKAIALSAGKDPALEMDLAESLVLSDNPATQPRARQLIDAALAANPDDPKALWYQGIMAVRAGDNETAKRNWTKLLDSNPPPEIREVIAGQLRELGVDVPSTGGEAAPAMAAAAGAGGMAGTGGDVAPQGRTIRISVKLDPKVAGQVKPGLPLFVSAREPGIPGPPIAATRLMSDQLPATVVLSDANSMIEGRTLSSVTDVEIVARVAVGGTVVPTSGDLLGRAVQKKGAGENLDVVIDQVQP